MTQIDLKEAQFHLLDLIRQAADGEEIIITQNDMPLARLIAAEQTSAKGKRLFGSAKGLITISEDFDAPLEDFSEYM